MLFVSVESFLPSVHVIYRDSSGTDCETVASEVAEDLSKE